MKRLAESNLAPSHLEDADALLPSPAPAKRARQPAPSCTRVDTTTPRNMSLAELKDLLLHAGIAEPHCSDLADKMHSNGVDTTEAIRALDEAQMFFLGATIGDQAKLRAATRHHRTATLGTPGPTQMSYSDSASSMSSQSSASNSVQHEASSEGEFVNGPVSIIRDITPKTVIGRGAFGVVMSGTWGEGGTPVALKSAMSNAPEETRQALVVEASVLSSLRHPNIVQMYGVTHPSGTGPMLLVTELMDGNLLMLLRTAAMPFATKARICRDVAAGMHYLVSNKIVHRDLAARNVLFQSGRTPVVKISDFGLSRIRWGMATDQEGVDNRLTIRWTAPEAFQHNQWSEQSDVWAFGVLMWEVMTDGAKPWDTLTSDQIRAAVLSGARLAQPPGCPDILYATMLRCWDANPASRPTFARLCRVLNEMFMRTLENPMQPDFVGIGLSPSPQGSPPPEENDAVLDLWNYHVNAKDVVIFLGNSSQKNADGSLVNVGGGMVGRPLWDFVAGAATQHLYKLLLRKVRESNRSMSFPFRCDSPSERRYLDMEIVPMPCRCVQFRSITRKIERRVSVQLLIDCDTPRDDSLPPLPMCSLCKKVRLPTGSWTEIEDALASGLFETGAVFPPLSHDCCDSCYRRVAARAPSS